MRAILLIAGLGVATSAFAQQPPETAPAQPPAVQAPAQPAAPPAAQPNPFMFSSDAAMLTFFIKPDKAADFEKVMEKLHQALANSDKPERKQQAAGWKVFKSPDPAGANVLYVFIIDPALKGADYQVSNLIAESFSGAEANDILTKYAAAYAQGMNIVNLNLLQNLGK